LYNNIHRYYWPHQSKKPFEFAGIQRLIEMLILPFILTSSLIGRLHSRIVSPYRQSKNKAGQTHMQARLMMTTMRAGMAEGQGRLAKLPNLEVSLQTCHPCINWPDARDSRVDVGALYPSDGEHGLLASHWPPCSLSSQS